MLTLLSGMGQDFYWFSPASCPVAWWEFFFVMTLTVWFSMVLARIDPWLVAQVLASDYRVPI